MNTQTEAITEGRQGNSRDETWKKYVRTMNVSEKNSDVMCRGQNEHVWDKTDITCVVLVLKSS